VGIGSWWRKLRKREDEGALDRAQELSFETPEERRHSSSDVTGLAADERTARLAGEADIEEAERLGDGE
jgi:hypothetical protein